MRTILGLEMAILVRQMGQRLNLAMRRALSDVSLAELAGLPQASRPPLANPPRQPLEHEVRNP